MEQLRRVIERLEMLKKETDEEKEIIIKRRNLIRSDESLKNCGVLYKVVETQDQFLNERVFQIKQLLMLAKGVDE